MNPIYRDDIVLAIELKAWGAQWKYIGRGLGFNHEALRRAVKKAEREGYPATRVRGTDWGAINARSPEEGIGGGSCSSPWDGADILAACLGIETSCQN